MNGQALGKMKNLKSVSLGRNICINEDFLSPNRIDLLPQFVSAKCGFTEAASERTDCDEKTASLNQTTLEKENLQKQLNEQISVVSANSAQITSLKVKLSAAEDAKAKAEKSFQTIERVYEMLDAQRNQTFAAKTEEMRNTIEAKLIENEDLLTELSEKSVKINDQAAKIKNLEEKIRIFESNNQF